MNSLDDALLNDELLPVQPLVADLPDIDLLRLNPPARAPAEDTIVENIVANLSQPQQIAIIMRTLQGMQDTMKAMQQSLDRIESRFDIEHHNSVARASNSRLTRDDMPLKALVDVKTGQPIPDFPKTPVEIRRLRIAHVEILLETQGVVFQGDTSEAKRAKLLDEVGLQQ